MSFLDIFRKKKETPPPHSSWQLRPNYGQGPFTSYFQGFVPRKINVQFMEFLRESLPIVDAAINRLVSLDGHIVVKGEKAALVDEIQDWISHVPVNDVQSGLQAWHQNMTGEAFEQGFVLGEFITDKKRRDIVSLRVGDSKFIQFKRSPTGLYIYQRSDDDTDDRKLDPSNLLYFAIHNENQNPHGTPLMRSCEFVSQILTTIQNTQKNVWERFGDPSFSIIYKTSKREGADLNQRRKVLEAEFATAIRAKRQGQSADFVRAIDTNSEIKIEVIGAEGQILDMEVPSRHVLEQIVAKTGLPPWMLGLHWSTTERLSNAEAEMLLADVATRQSAKMPLMERLVKTMLLLRGRTWKPGDWKLEWAGVNLHDIVAQAQARFLNAQADYYYLTNAREAGLELDIRDLAIGKKSARDQKSLTASSSIEDLETLYEDRLKKDWEDLWVRFKAVLALETPKQAKDGGLFSFTEVQRAMLLDALRHFIGEYSLDSPDSPITYYYGQSFSLGLIQAARIVDGERPLLNLAHNSGIFQQLCKDGFELVKNNATKAIQHRIMPEMEAYMLSGANPKEVAHRLEKLFGDANANWKRLARSEMSMAADVAKTAEWKARGIKRLEFRPNADACPICKALAGEYDIDDCPVKVRDTHPNCRCSKIPAESETI